MFIESIKLLDGYAYNLDLHQRRVDRTAEFFGISLTERPVLSEILNTGMFCPKTGLYKLRVEWGGGKTVVATVPYERRVIKKVALIEDDSLDYSFKFSDRSIFPLPSDYLSDEVIIVKGKMITDSTFSNLCFYDGKEWFTPEKPLLDGTKRRELTASGLIGPRHISVDDICKYTRISFINAMNGLEDMQYSFRFEDRGMSFPVVGVLYLYHSL